MGGLGYMPNGLGQFASQTRLRPLTEAKLSLPDAQIVAKGLGDFSYVQLRADGSGLPESLRAHYVASFSVGSGIRPIRMAMTRVGSSSGCPFRNDLSVMSRHASITMVAGTRVDVYLEHVWVGVPLPEMPLFIRPDRY